MRVCVQDASRPDETLCSFVWSVPDARPCTCREVASQQAVIPVVNKADAMEGTLRLLEEPKEGAMPAPILVSCRTGSQLDTLVEKLTAVVTQLCEAGRTAENPAVARARHRAHLHRCIESLNTARVRRLKEFVTG